MVKRILAGALGAIAILASTLPLEYALEDWKNPNVGQLVMCSIGVLALWMGIRFLRFAAPGQSLQTRSLTKSVLLGIAFFFPGFVFSLPLTLLCVTLTWTSDGKNYVAAVAASFCVGVAAAVICTIMLGRKHAIAKRSCENL